MTGSLGCYKQADMNTRRKGKKRGEKKETKKEEKKKKGKKENRKKKGWFLSFFLDRE